MYEIINSTTYKREDGSLHRACSIMADSVADLPTGKTTLDSLAINFGSWAWCMAEKTYKTLDSEGEWI